MSLLPLQTSFIPKFQITTNTNHPRRQNSVGKPVKLYPLVSVAHKPDPPDPKPKPKPKRRPQNPKPAQNDAISNFPGIIPRKPRRGRRSEAQAVEDQVRTTLEQALASMREQNPEIFENAGNILKERMDNDGDNEDDDGDDVDDDLAVMEEESEEWPLDAEVGWGIRASEYFDKHSIKNVVGDDGFEIDWEGEIDDNWVKEINCLEWESFAFHPSPLLIFVFERYNRASDNWKALKELEKAVRVYWDAKDRLPPRSVKIDINIEKDLAYALQVKEGPQILFLRGHRLLYREKEFRTADELVHMIAHFYYNAKKPSWMHASSVS